MPIGHRSVLTGALCGALVAIVGLAVLPNAAESMPLVIAKAGVVKTEPLVQKAQVIVVHPRRRGRPLAGAGNRPSQKFSSRQLGIAVAEDKNGRIRR